MITAAPIDYSKQDETWLRRWQAYWTRRLYSRGGGWFAEGMAQEAPAHLRKIEDALIAKGLSVEAPEPEPPKAA